MKVIVGLGNPGSRYAHTRHNIGFQVVDVLARSPSCGAYFNRFDSALAEMEEEGQRLLLLKPQTFMNLSGRCVQALVDFYKLPLERLLVVCDDMNLPLGKLRVRARGSPGGHNGLRDIEQHLGTSDYPRLRVGLGAPPAGKATEFVLGRFQPAEQKQIDDAVLLAAQATMVWAHQGIEECMNRYNG